MELNFFSKLDASNLIRMFDISSGTISGDIETMNLHVVSSKLGAIYDFNLIEYLNSIREQDELFILTGDKVGLSPEVPFPDGVYHFTYTLNGHITKTHKFLICQNIQSKVNQLVIDSEYKMNIGDYNAIYVNDDSNNKYDIEKVRMAVALFDKLLLYTQEPNEVEVNNLIDKLNRLLTIINDI